MLRPHGISQMACLRDYLLVVLIDCFLVAILLQVLLIVRIHFAVRISARTIFKLLVHE